MRVPVFLISALLIVAGLFAQAADRPLVVGSKRFLENQVLAELIAQHLENRGFTTERKILGGTFVAYRALKEDAIDFYVEYSGTLAEAVYKTSFENFADLQKHTEADGLLAFESLGFDNSYCLVVRKELFDSGVQKISDLKDKPDLVGGVSAEFRRRKDGWPKLSATFALQNKIINLENPMGYQALADQKVDFAEAYTTDAIVKTLNFQVLQDDKDFFPRYDAFILSRQNLPQPVMDALKELTGQLNNPAMMALNEQAMNNKNLRAITSNFLKSKGLMSGVENPTTAKVGFDWKLLGQRTLTHLFLTFWSVFFAALIALPLGVFIYKKKALAAPVLAFVGILQTIPSIALLSFMIPLFGIGARPALVGLLLYSLLPILRNTYTAFESLDPKLISVAKAIGLESRDIFFSISLPLSLPTIFAGLRTAATINIGTATLAAFIGAGGLGEPIVTGLAMNDSRIILEGAVPAALLAVVVDFALGSIEKIFVRKL